MVLEQLRKKTLKTVHINTCVSYRLFVLDKIRPENCFDSEQFGMISSVFRFNEWHLDQQRKLGKEEKYLFFVRGRRQGRQPLNPARGPLAVALPYGSSLLSVGERGRAPCRRRVGTAKNPRVLRCFVLVAFFLLFRSLWLKMGQHGPT